MNDKEALLCAAFWRANPDARVCPHHVPTGEFVAPRAMKSVPSRCPKCCGGELIETPEGKVPNWYGRLVFPTDPPNQVCINCGTTLVPVPHDRPMTVAA